LATVSVIIPCFNAAPFLAAAIDSIIQQPAEASQIIVVDDGSSDESAVIAKSFGSRVKLLRQQNSGISAARNAGLGLATAELLAFLDADDLWTRDSLAARLAVLADSPGTDCVFGEVEQFLNPDLGAARRARLAVDLRRQPMRHPGTMLIRRRAFDRVGPFNEDLEVGEMVEWIGRAEAAGITMHSTGELVMRRRIHESNHSLRNDLQISGFLRALKTSLDRRRASGKAPGPS
jgi:glycosyltransferase involved in cell wall biosynthesis